MTLIHWIVLVVQEVYVRGEVGIQLNFDFQLTFSLGDDNLFDEHSEARITYCTVSDSVFAI